MNMEKEEPRGAKHAGIWTKRCGCTAALGGLLYSEKGGLLRLEAPTTEAPSTELESTQTEERCTTSEEPQDAVLEYQQRQPLRPMANWNL